LLGNAAKIGAATASLPLLAHQTARSARAATKLKTSLAGGTPPDVFWATNPRDYVARGVVMDVTANVQADPALSAPDYFIQPQEQTRSTVNGKWYGIGSWSGSFSSRARW
jgi:ABC-type glycerol-3-phosphate transport system substrate-binding protein